MVIIEKGDMKINSTCKQLLLPVALFLCSAAIAQTTIPTAYTNAPGINALFTQPSYLAFDVTNNNSYAVSITDISNQHIAAATAAGPPVINYSQNGCRYSIWYNENNTATAPIDPMSGWVFGQTSNTVSTTANGIVPILSGMKDVIIPPGATYRFALVCSDSISAVGNTATPAAPGAFTTDGVTLTTVGLQWGRFPNNSQANGQAFNGSITFERGIHKPQLSINNSKSIYCIGDDVTISPKIRTYITNPSYTWRFNGNVVGTGNTYTIPGGASAATAGPYTCTVSDGIVTSEEAEITVKVTSTPAPTVDGKMKYCLNEQFEPLVVNGAAPKWYYVPTGGSPIPTTPTINTSSPNSLTYYVTQTLNGCESSERAEVNLRVAATPDMPIVNTPIYYCENDEPDQLTAIGTNLRWYYEQTGGPETVNAPTPNTSTNKEYDYFVTQTIDGCESERAKIDVVVTFRPNGLIKLDKKELCAGEDITLGYYGSAYDASQYNWSLPAGGKLINGGFDQGPLVVRVDSPGTQEIKLRVGNTGCMSELYIEEVRVKPLPAGEIVTKHDVCLEQDEIIEATNYTPTTDNFYWNFDGGILRHETTGPGQKGVFWTTPGEKEISLTLEDEGCTTTVTDKVMVHPKPDATITAADIKDGMEAGYNEGQRLCSGDSLKLSVATVEPNAQYSWSPANIFTDYNQTAVTYAKLKTDTRVHVAVEDIYGCRNESSLDVITQSCCEMYFPNAFSPNQDGRNDLFRPVSTGHQMIRTFKVVNRYGQVIYETAQANRGWDGTFNGKPADVGTYFYMISFDCEGEPVDQSGEVVLLR